MKKSWGFTLIELMIVVVIIAILAAIAIPSYQSSVIRSHRSEAKVALQGLAQAMERYYVQQNPNTYIGADAAGVPTIYSSTAPLDGGAARYNLRITSVTATSYTLQAQPIAGSSQANDGTIQLDNTGARAWDKNHNGNLTDAGENNWNDH
jgi:type IV pilus assembly protein PilE